ncbi:hypothetical protein GM3709_3140 [Geminocystis sp. NIES-3709]|nr:hypothetical protein GM3709_3140 [Geminocystis sp. NIES-3709]
MMNITRSIRLFQKLLFSTRDHFFNKTLNNRYKIGLLGVNLLELS